jgi:hypothetical protein
LGNARDENVGNIHNLRGGTNVGRVKGGRYIITCYQCGRQWHKKVECIGNQIDSKMN